MSNVRDYLKEKEKRQERESRGDGYSFMDKIRTHRLTIFYRLLLAIVLIAAVLCFLVWQWKNKIYTECVTLSSAEATIVPNAKTKQLGNHVLIYSKDGASCVDEKGNALWNQTFEMQQPILAACEDVAAIADYNGRMIYVVNSAERLGTVKTNLPIRNICVSANGVVAAVLDDGDVTRILLYNGNENTETSIADSKISMDKSGYPVSVSLSPNGKILAISYLYADSGSMKTSVEFLNFGEVGKNVSDNYVSGYDYPNEIVPYVQFMNSGAVFAVSDERIVFFEGVEKPESVASHLIGEEIQGIYYNESYVGLVFRNQTGESVYKMDVYDARGNKVHSLLFDIEYTDIVFYNDQIIIYDDMDLRVCTVKGNDKYNGELDKAVSLIVPTTVNYRYAAVTGSTVDTFELK
ncbi:MAG: hypothetical protein IKY23_00520 [Lachnospiraceae bacterium]|nr:hypothetical protein [Lachnospiraceae bacterium]